MKMIIVVMILEESIAIPGGEAPKNPCCISWTTEVIGFKRHNHMNLYGTTDIE
jgi:hypothetical protein